MSAGANAFREMRFTVRDGLVLYARHYPAPKRSHARPILCLAGLTRNSRDFDRIARFLSGHPTAPRDVYTLDSRGRGQSEHDRDWRNYSVPNEMQDVIDFMTMMELFDAGIIGTSRGGLITMVLAAAQPGRIGAAVLNDIGPVIETQGLMRIASYVGKVPVPKTWQEAANAVLELTKRDFPGLGAEEAEAFARQLFNEINGKPAPGYDSKLSRCLTVLDGPMPQLWPQFGALKHAPILVVRGANSDLLSTATVEEMHRRHPHLQSVTAPNEGHAPLLWDHETQVRIAVFFAEADALRRRHSLAA